MWLWVLRRALAKKSDGRWAPTRDHRRLCALRKLSSRARAARSEAGGPARVLAAADSRVPGRAGEVLGREPMVLGQAARRGGPLSAARAPGRERPKSNASSGCEHEFAERPLEELEGAFGQSNRYRNARSALGQAVAPQPPEASRRTLLSTLVTRAREAREAGATLSASGHSTGPMFERTSAERSPIDTTALEAFIEQARSRGGRGGGRRSTRMRPVA
jgi:hypothetical protein